jgi:hypothetical protein
VGTQGRGTSNFSSMTPETFELEHFKEMEEVRANIQKCEGHHTQQAIYSTFHDALTQICYGCKKIRTTL